MIEAVMIMAVLLPMLMAAAFLLGRYLHRRQQMGDELSAVTRQHIDLFQGGQLNEKAVESAKARFRDLLERGEVAAVEASLRPGMHYVIQVRALTELGTDEAGRILERQLHRRLTTDQIEQSWYWIDLANGLRNLNREESLPHLLRCAESAGDIPLGHFFAAETVCFLGFAGYLRQPETMLGRAAPWKACASACPPKSSPKPGSARYSKTSGTIGLRWFIRFWCAWPTKPGGSCAGRPFPGWRWPRKGESKKPSTGRCRV
jgi:hypothetical protein